MRFKSACSLVIATILMSGLLVSCKDDQQERQQAQGKNAKKERGSADQEDQDTREEGGHQSGGKGGQNNGQNNGSTPSPDGQELDNESTPNTRTTLPDADFTFLLDDPGEKGPGSFQRDYRTSDKFFTRMPTMVQGDSPHGWVRIWYSANIENIIDRATFTVPEGTVAIKKFQNDEMTGFAVMVKKKAGYDDENNDWYYELRDETGEVLQDPAPGKIKACISCHAAAQGKDFLAGTTMGFTDQDDPVDNADAGTGAGTGSGTGTGMDTGTGNNPPVISGTKGPGKFVPDFALSKDFFTETKEFVKGKSPHGNVRVWYSKNIKDMIANAALTAPEGTVAIKEFDNDGTPGVDGVAIMIKKTKGYDPKNNDWYYELRDPWGVALADPAPGKIKTCYNCHVSAKATDYLAATKLSRGATGGAGPSKFKADYFDSNQFFTQTQDMKAGKHHGNIQIWYSNNAEGMVGQDKVKMPDGTVAIARYKQDAAMGLVVMVKDDGYDPDNGDWRYELRDRYGNLLWDPRPGKIEACITCHKSARDTDYFKGTKIKD